MSWPMTWIKEHKNQIKFNFIQPVQCNYIPFINIWVMQATKTLFSSLLISEFDTKIQTEFY